MAMAEPKPLASLTSGLLARKGAAQPAMRRPVLSGFGRAPLGPTPQDDLGWNDMGFDLPAVAQEPVAVAPLHEVAEEAPLPLAEPMPAPAVVVERQMLADRMGAAGVP